MQYQYVVSPNSATMEQLTPNAKHFGQLSCPFCYEIAIVAGPSNGYGLAWVFKGCSHVRGTMATEKEFEISILFESNTKNQMYDAFGMRIK